ncbi:nudC domain-containing protein 1 [Diachasma alloeum]|uniref:nudC domain-containing protein 1 n=1 Tax=Diachasma alloeum TaxID=454923 RepID=UPI0007382135|nr:nudC domain-containing protein 1 [Diachasma alloeum]
MPKIVDLRPKKELLNVKFEKYQFSTQIVPVTEEIKLSKKVTHLEPSPGQDSLLEARLFAFHNHLFQSPYDDSCWFFDEDENLWCLESPNTLHHVHSLPKSPTKSYNSTIAFASQWFIALSNGGGALHILMKNQDQQKVIPIEADSGVLLAARHVLNDNALVLVMVSTIEENSKKRSKIILLNYSVKSQENFSENSIELSRRQELMVNGAVDYVHIESSGDFIDVLSGDSVKFTVDSMTPIDDASSSDKSELKIPKYYWSQDADSLTVWLKIPERHKDARADVKVTATSLAVTVEDSVLMQGECQFRIDEGTATWSRDKDTFRMEVTKQEGGQMWSELIRGDTGGEHLPNEGLAAEIHSRLSHLCTDQPEGATAQPAIGFNAEQLEECDLEGDQSYLQRIDLQEHLTTHLAILGTNNRLLFTQTHRLCIRQDHDGCVWSLLEAPNDWNVQHESTFPGFGYVEASKSNKKFCISPQNGDYVAIVEHNRHAFIYEKPGLDAKVAKQKIVDLGAEALPIMGAVATDDHLILLTQDKLYKLKVN